MTVDDFPSIQFSGQLRTSQAEVAALAAKHFSKGNRRLHVVAPPGSGKTILGLYLWAHLVKQPAIVLSPNSAIQAQWAARTRLFHSGPERLPVDSDWVSTLADQPALLTSLTYQAVTLPQRGNEDWQQQAVALWKENLIQKEQAQDLEEATVWLADLEQQNPDYYQDRLGMYRKRVREGLAADGRNLELLHQSSLHALHQARDAGVGLLILDECHHLVGHWGRVLNEAIELLGNPVVIGLTATPPDTANKSAEDVRRYQELLGDVLYEVPVPAVVKDGFLAPYQDLVQFVRPTAAELDFISNVDRQFQSLLEQACSVSSPATDKEGGANVASSETLDGNTEPSATDVASPEVAPLVESSSASAPVALIEWVRWTLLNRQLPQGVQPDWKSFSKRDPTFSDAARQFLLTLGQSLPKGVPHLTLPNDLVPLRQRNLDLLSLERKSDKTTNKPDPSIRTSTSEGQGGLSNLLAKQIHDLPLSLTTPVLDRYIRHRLRRSSKQEDRQLADTLIGRLRLLGVQITETGFQACASPVSRVLAYSQSKSNAMVRILAAEMDSLQDRTRAVVITDYERTSAVESEISDLMDQHAGGAIAAFRSILDDPKTNQLDPVLLTGSTVLVDPDLNAQLQSAANDWLKSNGFNVQLRSTDHGQFMQLDGSGADWCPRVYVEMITELFQAGVTRCLVGTRGLLGEGWDASRTNVLVDLTTVTTSMSINQLRGRSIRLDKDWPEKVANNWDVVCVAPEFAKGFDDFDRFKKKHASLFGVADDGQVEKGAGHVHSIFNEMQPEQIETSMRPMNHEMMARAAQRSKARANWKIGQTYRGQLSHSIELRRRHSVSGRREFSTTSWRPQLWNANTLTESLAKAILEALIALKKIASGQIQMRQRENQTVRIFLQEAGADDARLFAESLSQIMGPIDDARYIIPRNVTVYEANWLSQWFPNWIGGWMESKRKSIMWHAVPDALSGNKQEVSVFQQIWNRQISNGAALYAHRGQGREQMVAAIESRSTPDYVLNQTEIFD